MNLDFIAYPLGRFLYFIYNTIAFRNYGLALILFTVIVRLALLPLTIKQYKSTAKMQAIQPKIQEIQKRYKNDKEKLNTELMRIYQENDVNPAGGCLPLLIQMPIIIALYWVIVQPLKFMLGKTAEQITTLVEYATKAVAPAQLGAQKELSTLIFFNEHFEKFKEIPQQVANILKPEELINMKFLGLNLGKVPSFSPSVLFGPEASTYLPLILIPILAVVTTFISAKLTMPRTDDKNKNQAAGATNSMMYVGPIMTLLLAFQLPAGVSLYWTAGYVVQIFQQLYINKHVINKKEVATK